MSNSSLVDFVQISPNRTSPRNKEIDTVTIHCYVGQVTVERMGRGFADPNREASCNYGIGYDGKIGMYCEEKDRSWCSGGYETVNGKKVPIRVNGISGSDNDHQAITIEVACDSNHPYAVTDKAYEALINLLVDICKRNPKISRLKWKGNKSLVGKTAEQNMTVHRWFANKACPGDYLYTRHSAIAEEVNKRLNTSVTSTTEKPSDTFYRVQVGAYSSIVLAQNRAKKINEMGFATYIVKVGNLYKIQVGVFSKKENANAMLKKLKAAGIDGFITTEKGSSIATKTTKKSVDEIAKEVIQGKWGNGSARVTKLKQAGYDPVAIQNRVNQLLNK